MKRYFIIYKPYLVLSQFTSQLSKKTLADFYSFPGNVYPVGRLDEDSEGLLILTNDTALNQRLLHPSSMHEREYWVQVENMFTGDAATQISEGVEINVNGKLHRTGRCKITIMNEAPPLPLRDPPVRFRKNIPTSWISITLTEGKNRQVRKMTAAVGFPTLRLVRYRIGNITLGNLQPGEMIEMPAKTIYKKLFNEQFF